jgi:hypothetical protein
MTQSHADLLVKHGDRAVEPDPKEPVAAFVADRQLNPGT